MFDNYIVMVLFFIGCAIAMRIGWLMGVQFTSNQFTKKQVAAIEEEIRQKYYARLEEKFKIAVEKRAREIVDEYFVKIEDQKKGE